MALRHQVHSTALSCLSVAERLSRGCEYHRRDPGMDLLGESEVRLLSDTAMRASLNTLVAGGVNCCVEHA